MQTSITQFTKVSKLSETQHLDKKTQASSTADSGLKKKRPFAAILDSEDEEDAAEVIADKRPKLAACKVHGGQRKSRPNPQSLPTPDTTPTKPSRYKDCLKAAQPTPQLPTILDEDENEDEATDYTYNDEHKTSRELPAELQNIINLQSSFINALVLHYGHSGTAVPIRLTTFLPSIAKIWGKRAVSVLDIQRCLGLMSSTMSSSSARFILTDHGRGQTCLELVEDSSAASTFTFHSLVEPFATALRAAWEDSQALFPAHLDQADAEEIRDFISTLPLAPIKPSPSLKKIAPLFARGQRELESLIKPAASSTTGQSSSTASPSSTKTETRTSRAVLGRTSSMLERLKAKKEAAAAAPAAPSRECLERQAALSRMPDIVSTLCMLRAASNPGRLSGSSESAGSMSRRQTFSMTSLVQRVQDSSRNVLSKEEVERCITLLAEDVAKGCEFVELVGTGNENRSQTGKVLDRKGLLAVVVDATKMPLDMERRIEEAMKKGTS